MEIVEAGRMTKAMHVELLARRRLLLQDHSAGDVSLHLLPLGYGLTAPGLDDRVVPPGFYVTTPDWSVRYDTAGEARARFAELAPAPGVEQDDDSPS